jgi:hypothetical protein
LPDGSSASQAALWSTLHAATRDVFFASKFNPAEGLILQCKRLLLSCGPIRKRNKLSRSTCRSSKTGKFIRRRVIRTMDGATSTTTATWRTNRFRDEFMQRNPLTMHHFTPLTGVITVNQDFRYTPPVHPRTLTTSNPCNVSGLRCLISVDAAWSDREFPAVSGLASAAPFLSSSHVALLREWPPSASPVGG